jgi:hypothetical protein
MLRILRLPFHPFLMGIYPIIHLYARNIAFIPLIDAMRPLGITLGLTFIFLIGFRMIVKSWHAAGLITSALLIMFFFFGHIANLLEDQLQRQGMPFDISLFAWIWLILFLPLPLLILRFRPAEKPTQLLNLIGLMLILWPLASIIAANVDRSLFRTSELESLAQMRGEAQAEASLRALPQSEKPDIYYIILDAYERADILEEYYGYDNSSFMDALENRGFYIGSSSRSNYLTTTYSLNTSLNLLYFHEFPAGLFKQSRFNLYTNYVSEFLRKQAYQVVVFDSGTGDSNFQYADVFASSPSIQVNASAVTPFEQLLLQTTYVLALIKRNSSDEGARNDVFTASVNYDLEIRRERIRYAAEHLPDYAAQDNPRFIFAHIYLPHFPFLYGPGGEELKYHGKTNLFWYEVEPEDYVDYYGYQIDYLNRTMLQTIDRILAGARRPLVIILQSDHGDEHFLNWDAPTAQGVNARSAILNAFFFSDGGYEQLYPSMTPVNSFRVILNHWFGTQYPLLPDKTYFHEHPVNTPYTEIPEFIESCARFNICLPARLN